VKITRKVTTLIIARRQASSLTALLTHVKQHASSLAASIYRRQILFAWITLLPRVLSVMLV